MKNARNEEYYVWPETDEYQDSDHTDHLFCDDMTCPCHEDQDNIDQLAQAYQDGLASKEDCDRIYRGKVV